MTNLAWDNAALMSVDLMEKLESKVLLHHGIGRGGAATPAVNAPGSEVQKPTGKGEAAGHAAAPDAGRGQANNAGPNAKRGNVRPS